MTKARFNEKTTGRRVLEMIPVYPTLRKISDLGDGKGGYTPSTVMKNFMSDILIAEDDCGRVCFLSEEDKQKSIRRYMEEV